MQPPKVIGLAGWSGSGKTTLALRLIALLKQRDLKVATLKHAHHAFDVDRPGKDSYRHREAGADEVIVASGQRIAHMIEAPLPEEQRRPLADLLARVGEVDVVIVEGFKAEAHPKLEVWRKENGKSRLLEAVPNVIAVAAPKGETSDEVPTFDLNAPETWIDDLLSLWPEWQPS